jgi:hypothetical protein
MGRAGLSWRQLNKPLPLSSGARNTPFVTRADEHAEWNWIFTFPYRSWLSFYETSRARVTKWTLGPPVGFGFPDYKENGLAVSPKGHGGPRVYR